MKQLTPSTLQCSNCGTPNQVTLRSIIDVQNDPQGKVALLNGQINQFQCQQCGTVNSVSTPLLYHDASKEMLIAFVPMDVAMRQGTNRDSEEKIVGQMMNELTSSMPKEEFRSYMFNPSRALTMKGLIEQVLEADGVTPDMMEAQQARVDLVQKFLEAQTEEDLIALVKENDDAIDIQLFQTLSIMAQRLMQSGQQQAVGHLAAIQQVLIEESSVGQQLDAEQAARDDIIEDVAAEIEALGQGATRTDFLDLAIKYADNDDKIQALVGMARPAFDEQLLSEFGERISKAPADEREKLEAVRDSIIELSAQIDQQSQMLVQQKAQFLQVLLNSPDYESILRDNIAAVDDTFMAVLSANIQQAEQRADVQVAARLKAIYNTAVSLLQSQMSPELRFVNELLTAETDEAMQTIIDEKADQFDASMMEVLDAVENMLAQQGQGGAIQRLGKVRTALEGALN
ncbi:MAG: CpXC domain-containing protein [Chloroflexota bacterium]